MKAAFICDAVRTPIGRYGGALATCAQTTWLRRPFASWCGAIPAQIGMRWMTSSWVARIKPARTTATWRG